MTLTRFALERRPVVTGLSLPHTARSVGDARRLLRADLLRADLHSADLHGEDLPAGTAADAEVVLAELLGNAVRHARPRADGTVGVSWRIRSRAVDIAVVDGGSPLVVIRRDPPPLATGGRGLQLVSALARAWGVVDLGDRGSGRTVWAALVAEPPRRAG